MKLLPSLPKFLYFKKRRKKFLLNETSRSHSKLTTLFVVQQVPSRQATFSSIKIQRQFRLRSKIKVASPFIAPFKLRIRMQYRHQHGQFEAKSKLHDVTNIANIAKVRPNFGQYSESDVWPNSKGLNLL